MSALSKSFAQELKIALQSLSSRGGFATTVILTLGITLGALLTFFNLNQVLLLKSLPYPDNQQLFLTQHVMQNEQDQSISNSPLAPGLLHTYKNQQSFEQMTILSTGSEFLTSHPEQPNMAITFTTPEYFELLAMPMTLGRTFSNAEGLEQNNPVVILSHQSWHKWFQGRSDIIGSKLTLRDISYTIIGVAAEDFVEPQITGELSDLWAPWDFNGMTEGMQQSWGNGQSNIAGLGKISLNTPLQQIQANLSTQLNSAYQNHLASLDNREQMSSSLKVQLQPLKAHLLGNSHLQALLLMGAVLALLVIACTNVINLFYSRAAEKQRTFAIQAALGARKKHLFTAMFAESLLLTGAAGLLGLLTAMWGIDLVKTFGQDSFNRLHELGLEPITLCFAVLMSVILAAVFAALSSRIVNYEKLREQLQSSGKGSGLQISRRTRNVLVVSQIFLASILLIGASMVLDKAWSVINQPLGYDSSVMYRFSLDERIGLIEADEIERRNQLINELTVRIKQLPQVVELSPSFNTAIGYGMIMQAITRDNEVLGSFPANFVSDKYFDTMQLPLIEGRAFTETDLRENAPVAILSRSAAEIVGKGQSAIGLQLTIGGGAVRTVIGVVQDVYDPSRTDSYQYRDAYLPHVPWNVHFVMRLKPDTEVSRQQLVAMTRDVSPGLRLASYEAFSDRHNRVVQQDKVSATVAAGLSLLALLLAGAGIFGVMSYSSQMRRYELGVRMALGAKARQVTALVIKDNMRPIATGLTFTVLLVTILYTVGHQQYDWFKNYSLLPLLLTIPVILGTALLASYLPVRSVLKKDPIKALRSE